MNREVCGLNDPGKGVLTRAKDVYDKREEIACFNDEGGGLIFAITPPNITSLIPWIPRTKQSYVVPKKANRKIVSKP